MNPEGQTPKVEPEISAQPTPTVAPPEQPQSVPAQEVTPDELEQDINDTVVPDEQPRADGPSTLPSVEPVQWQAAEYLQHEKPPIWYIGFGVILLLLMVAAILLMGSWTFAILIPVMAIALVVYAHRPPRQLNYVVSEKGLYINEQLHPMGEFKAFGVVQDGTQHALTFIPVKRFRPALTVYFPDKVGERLVDAVGAYLPMQEVKLDVVDRLTRKLRI